jgi:hypothetical protein
MKTLASLFVLAMIATTTRATEETKLAFDTYTGYFVSNKFEPDAAASYVIINDQAEFDKVFGVAAVMEDKSHRLPEEAFKSNMIVATIKRGNASCEYKVESVTVEKGVVTLQYTVTSEATPETTYACPLIVSISKGDYKAVVFKEDGKQVKKVKIGGKKRD